MEQNKPAPVEISVTWGFAWALWWRWMLMSTAFMAIVYVPIFLLVVATGIMRGF